MQNDNHFCAPVYNGCGGFDAQTMQGPSSSSSRTISTVCAVVTAVLMILLRPVFRWSAETTFLGGFFGAILFFFLLITAGNLKDQKTEGRLGWFSIAVCEFIALAVSFVIHPVCITTCVLFSVPVVIYIKWAATKMIELQRASKSK